MTVRVSRHAIERFRQRSEVARQDHEIVRLLTAIVLLKRSPSAPGEWRIRNRGLVLAGITTGDTATVRSCWFQGK